VTAIGTPNPEAVQQFLIAVLDYSIARDAAIERECALKAAELIQPTPGSAMENPAQPSAVQNKMAVAA
jgi:hypothetical protein